MSIRIVNGIELTPEAFLRIVKSKLTGVANITKAQERTLLSMLGAFIEDEDYYPGNTICDFLGILRRDNKNAIDEGIKDFINANSK